MIQLNYEFALLGGFPLILILLLFVWQRTRNVAAVFYWGLFSLYLLLALTGLLFPLPLGRGSIPSMSSLEGFLSRIHLVPFAFGRFPYAFYHNILPNVLLTLPFGFGISFVARLRPRDFLWLPVAVGLGTETLQLLVSLLIRYPYRVIDINDSFSNALGVLLGYALFRVFAWLYLGITQRFGLPRNPLARYTDAVARRTCPPSADR